MKNQVFLLDKQYTAVYNILPDFRRFSQNLVLAVD